MKLALQAICRWQPVVAPIVCEQGPAGRAVGPLGLEAISSRLPTPRSAASIAQTFNQIGQGLTN